MAEKTRALLAGETAAGDTVVGGADTDTGNLASYDVDVELSLSKSVGKSGFGIPLILVGGQEKEIPYTECLDADEVAAVFPAGTPVHDAAKLMYAQSTERFKIAVCGAKEKSAVKVFSLLGKDWRQLVVPTAGTEADSTIKEISDAVEKTDRMYFATVKDLSEAPGKTVELEAGKTAPRDRTVCFKHGKNAYAAAALVGAIAQKDPGTYTCKNQILKELEPEALDDTQIKTAHDAGCLCFVTKAGDNVTTEGKTLGGEYIDIIDSKDYVIYRIQYGSQKVFNQNDKVAYTDSGITQLENVCVTVMKECYGDGNLIIDTDDSGKPAYSVNYGRRSETSAADRQARRYTLGRFSFSLLGAIHTAKVKGSIIV